MHWFHTPVTFSCAMVKLGNDATDLTMSDKIEEVSAFESDRFVVALLVAMP